MPSARSVSITLNGIRDGCHCMRWCLLFRIMIVLRQSKRAPLYARDTLRGHRTQPVSPRPPRPPRPLALHIGGEPERGKSKKSTQITKHSTRTATHTGGIRRPRRCSVSRRLILPTNVTGYFTYPTDLSICDQCHCAGVRPHTHTHTRAPLSQRTRGAHARGCGCGAVACAKHTPDTGTGESLSA